MDAATALSSLKGSALGAALLAALGHLPGDLAANVNLVALARIVLGDVATGKSAAQAVDDVIAAGPAVFTSAATRPVAVALLTYVVRPLVALLPSAPAAAPPPGPRPTTV